jgi:membrane protease YdiL (CAAX protease family)
VVHEEEKAVEPGPDGGPGRCSYCGATLDPRFYFCTTCATPYTSPESLLPPRRARTLSEGELISLDAPHVAPVFWTYFSVVLGAGLVGFVLLTNGRPDLAFYVQSGAFLATTCVLGAIHWRALSVQLRRVGVFQPAFLLCLVLLVPLLGVNYLYHGWLVRHLGLPQSPLMEHVRQADPTTAIILVCIFPAVSEEIGLRGLVQHWLQTAIKPWRALLIASALFALLHFSLLSAPYLFAVGMLLGYAKWKTGSLYPSIVLHFLHNLIILEMFGG